MTDDTLTFSTLWALTMIQQTTNWYFFFFPKIGFDISCKCLQSLKEQFNEGQQYFLSFLYAVKVVYLP